MNTEKCDHTVFPEAEVFLKLQLVFLNTIFFKWGGSNHQHGNSFIVTMCSLTLQNTGH